MKRNTRRRPLDPQNSDVVPPQQGGGSAFDLPEDPDRSAAEAFDAYLELQTPGRELAALRAVLGLAIRREGLDPDPDPERCYWPNVGVLYGRTVFYAWADGDAFFGKLAMGQRAPGNHQIMRLELRPLRELIQVDCDLIEIGEHAGRRAPAVPDLVFCSDVDAGGVAPAGLVVTEREQPVGRRPGKRSIDDLIREQLGVVAARPSVGDRAIWDGPRLVAVVHAGGTGRPVITRFERPNS